jgi:5-methylcytosine-specific restriction enzyme subunit McrC
VQVEDRRWLRLDNYVGVIETPCGTRIEILPKHERDALPAGHTGTQREVAASRSLLCRMIASAMDLPVREVGETALQRFDAPLSEWVMAQFLAVIDHLVKRGVRSDYVRVDASERHLRGQLDVVRQLRLPPGRQHVFQIRHDIYSPDRPENRLLKLAVERICQQTQNPASWRLAQELRALFHDIPRSASPSEDFKRWRADRLMAHYQAVRPWCELVLSRQMPLSVAGAWQGISLLFPMEKLFERYVASCLRSSLLPQARLVAQATSRSLCEHDDGAMFQLRPDLLVECEGRRWVLDTKWKLVDAGDKARNYGLSQADFYQLFAYGQKYLGGKGEMALIYPRTAKFREMLPVFRFEPELGLWVVPFDLEAGRLVDGGVTTLPLRGTAIEPATAFA